MTLIIFTVLFFILLGKDSKKYILSNSLTERIYLTLKYPITILDLKKIIFDTENDQSYSSFNFEFFKNCFSIIFYGLWA